MGGIKIARKVQLGRESTAGTAVAATAIWRGPGMIDDQMDVRQVEESVGLVVPSDRNYIASYLAAIELESVEATFEQIFHPLEAGIKTVATGAADGGGTGKVYDYTFPTTTANTLKTYTIEAGDNQQEEEMEYCFVSEMTIGGASKEAVMVSSSWLGRQVTASTFTGSLSIPTVEEILFGKAKLYINADTSAFGTTIKSNTLLNFELRLNTGWIPKFTADGALYFSFPQYVGMRAELDLTFEHDGTATVEKTAWRAKTARAIQILMQGSALGTPGTTYTYKSLIINLAGKWSKFEKVDEVDGNDVVTGTLVGSYSSSRSTMGNIIVVNEVASVP